jgi:hypothetical protein
MMLSWRRRAEWRYEPGPGYTLRQYWRGRPTGMIAVTTWDEQPAASPHTMVSGPDVCLIHESTQLIVAEHPTDGRGVVRLQIPMQSCVDALIVDEPGLPGDAMVRLTLTVRVGRNAIVTLPLWFPAEHRPFLDDLTRRIRHDEPACSPPARSLPLLEVALAPGDDDWVVFRPAASSNDVLVPRASLGGPVDRSAGGVQ